MPVSFINILGLIISNLFSWWWIWLPIILFLILKNLWTETKRKEYVSNIKWTLLEIRIPREIKKSPKAMEQVFAGLHGIYNSPNFIERNFNGFVQEWFSLEIASFGGAVHFFIRTPEKYRNLVEAQIYAQYPDIEISEVNDYTQLIPENIPNENYDIWGGEFCLTKPDFYPIRTYSEFVDPSAEEQVDPVSSLMEVLSKLDPQEQIWVQVLIRPIGDEWKKEGRRYIDKKIGRRGWGGVGDELKDFIDEIGEAFSSMLSGRVREPRPKIVVPKELPRRVPRQVELKGPGETLTGDEWQVLSAIEKNISKIGFETIIRFVYLSPKEIFSKANVSAIVGCFKQFNTENLNGFKINKAVSVNGGFLNKKKNYRRKRLILSLFKKRYFPLKSKYIKYLRPGPFSSAPRCFVFNIEELATVYHFPGTLVVAPTIPKIEARKAKPPVGLPI